MLTKKIHYDLELNLTTAVTMCVGLTSEFVFSCFQASFTPFLTEFNYQSLRPFIPESMKIGETESVHYLMIPKARWVHLLSYYSL